MALSARDLSGMGGWNEEALDTSLYHVVPPDGALGAEHCLREERPRHYAILVEEDPIEAAQVPSVFDRATGLNGFRAKLRILMNNDPGLVGNLVHIQRLVARAEAGEEEDGGVEGLGRMLPMWRIHLENDLRQILAVDADEHFGLQDLWDVLADYQAGYVYEISEDFQPVPEDWNLNEDARIVCEASRQGAWLLHHYLGRDIAVEEKGYAGDVCSDLDKASDLAAVTFIRHAFRGRVASATLSNPKAGTVLFEADDTPEAIRARGEVPVFIAAEESSPDVDYEAMEVGDKVVFVDGMDGSSAAKFKIPGGASVMVGIGHIAQREDGRKYVDLAVSSVLFQGSKAVGNESEWFFAAKGEGAYLQRGERGPERLDVSGGTLAFKDCHFKLNRYGDKGLASPGVTRIQERVDNPGQSWTTPAGFTVGLPSSEHGLRVVDPYSGHQVSVSDNWKFKEKVGDWDLVTSLIVTEAGGVVQTLDGEDVQIPCKAKPMVFAQSQALADGVRTLAAI